MATTSLLDSDEVLGAAIANFPSDRLRLLIISALLGGSIALVMTLFVAPRPDWWAPPLTVIVVAATGLALGWYVLHNWNREVILYERGFTYTEGSKIVPFRYDEVAALRLRAERLRYFGGLLPRDVYEFTIRTFAGDQFRLKGGLYRRAPELGTRLTEQVNAALAPRLRATFNSGTAVEFADGFSVSKAGLHHGSMTLPWSEFGGTHIGSGKLGLLQTDGSEWLALRLTEIDNVTLLLDLIRSQRA